MNPDFRPAGGDGPSGGEYNRAKLLGALSVFLSDPINFLRVSTAMLSAPPEDRALLQEAYDNFKAGIDPGEHAVQAVLEYAGIFCGTIVYRDGTEELDVGFVGDESEE